MKKINDLSLYLVTSEEYSKGRSVLEVAQRAISGGIDIMQMREKHKSRKDLKKLGGALLSLCRKEGVTFIVNDDPTLAEELDADGVHLGQRDIEKYPVKKTREILGNDKIIGLSTHSLAEFEQADESDVDYIAFGPIFKTPTKDYCIGTENIEKILENSSKPVIFIGGINPANVNTVLDMGARNIAVIRAIAEAEDIKHAAEGLKKEIKKRNQS